MIRGFLIAFCLALWLPEWHVTRAPMRVRDVEPEPVPAAVPVTACPLDDPLLGYCSTRYPFDVAIEQHGTYGVLRWHGAETTFTVPPVRIEQDGGTLLVTYRLRPNENGTLTPEFP